MGAKWSKREPQPNPAKLLSPKTRSCHLSGDCNSKNKRTERKQCFVAITQPESMKRADLRFLPISSAYWTKSTGSDSTSRVATGKLPSYIPSKNGNRLKRRLQHCRRPIRQSKSFWMQRTTGVRK